MLQDGRLEKMIHGVLHPGALEAVSRAALALAEVSAEEPGQTGLFGAMRAAGDENVKRALNFAVRFGKRFGQLSVKSVGDGQ